MKILLIPFLTLLLLCSVSCRTKYDTGNAIEILPSSEIFPDYRLSDVKIELDNTDHVVNINEYQTEVVYKIPKSATDTLYNDGFLYLTTPHELIIVNLESSKNVHVRHDVEDGNIAVSGNLAMVYDILGNFTLFDTKTKQKVWSNTLNIEGLASRFICNDKKQKCYALDLSGNVITVDYQYHIKDIKKVFQKQNIILNHLYEPLIVDDKIIFAIGNSRFGVYDIVKNQLVAESSFVDEETSSLFDINLVNKIYEGGKHIVVSHIHGSFAFSMLYGRQLWIKDFIFHHGFIANNYIIFLEEGTKKLMSVHLDSGEVKWMKDIDFLPIEIDITYGKEIVILERNGIHTFDVETGKMISYKKLNMHKMKYAFVYNHELYYTAKGKLYRIK